MCVRITSPRLLTLGEKPTASARLQVERVGAELQGEKLVS